MDVSRKCTFSHSNACLFVVYNAYNSIICHQNVSNLNIIYTYKNVLRNVITCSTKTEKVIREKTGTRIDKWVGNRIADPEPYFE